jgi:hypothetical protein
MTSGTVLAKVADAIVQFWLPAELVSGARVMAILKDSAAAASFRVASAVVAAAMESNADRAKKLLVLIQLGTAASQSLPFSGDCCSESPRLANSSLSILPGGAECLALPDKHGINMCSSQLGTVGQW